MYRNHPDFERTLVLLKPDAVQRGLMGEIISRFEKKGLTIAAMKMEWPDAKKAREHYFWPESDMLALGERTLKTYAEKGEKHKHTDPIKIAMEMQDRLVDYMTTGPVLAMVIEGIHAVAYVRKMRGATNPLSADVGTIAADFTVDSYFLADTDERAARNLVHASGSAEEAKREIKIWFTEKEIFKYIKVSDYVIYSKAWERENQQSLSKKELE